MLSRFIHGLLAQFSRGISLFALAGMMLCTANVAQAGWHIEYVEFGSDTYVIAVNEKEDKVVVLGIDNSKGGLHPNPYSPGSDPDGWDSYLKFVGDKDTVIQALKDGAVTYLPPEDMLEFQENYLQVVGSGLGYNGGIIPVWNPGDDGSDRGPNTPTQGLPEDDFVPEAIAMVKGVGSFGAYVGGPEGEGPQGEGAGTLLIRWGHSGGKGSGEEGDGDEKTDQLAVSFGFVGEDGYNLLIHPKASH